VTDSTKYRLGLGLLVGGLALAVLCFAGYALGIGETTSTTRAQAAEDESATSSSEPSSTTSSTVAVRTETPDQFLADLQQAERGGDSAFLLARLHPAVIERYGEDVCRSQFASEPPDPTSTFDVVGIDHTGPWDYTSDGQTTTIPNTVFVLTNRTVHAQPAQQIQVHIAPVDGQQRWFTDCTPG
jgi:hypothetical protein